MLLIVLNAFLAITAMAGGIGLLIGVPGTPLEDLAGSPSPDHTVPGLALLLFVGGVAAAAAILALLRHPLAQPASLASGLVVIFFEFVEVLVIGSPPGVARNLQLLYFRLGLVVLALSLAWWIAGRRVVLAN